MDTPLFSHNSSCPHCKQAVTATEWLEVKGLQQMEDIRASINNLPTYS